MAPDQLFISADIAVMAVSRFKSIAVDVMNSAILRWLYIGEDENSNGMEPAYTVEHGVGIQVRFSD